jgi:hypothetical protein
MPASVLRLHKVNSGAISRPKPTLARDIRAAKSPVFHQFPCRTGPASRTRAITARAAASTRILRPQSSRRASGWTSSRGIVRCVNSWPKIAAPMATVASSPANQHDHAKPTAQAPAPNNQARLVSRLTRPYGRISRSSFAAAMDKAGARSQSGSKNENGTAARVFMARHPPT